MEEIVELSHTSKGSFYHCLDRKDTLLSTLNLLFDEKYGEPMEILDARPQMSVMDRLLFFNSKLFGMIESNISMDLLACLLSTRFITNGGKHLLNHNRTYCKFLRKIIAQRQDSGQLNTGFSVSEMVELYALSERVLLYDWCLCQGEYSLRRHSVSVMPAFLNSFLPSQEV